MKRLRRLIFWFAFIIIIVSIVLLMNITAPNPTGRRYSSQIPLTTGEGSDKERGDSAEHILSLDLRIPNNNDQKPKQYFCNREKYKNKPPTGDGICIILRNEIRDYRFPDFIGNDIIIDSKNTLSLRASGHDYNQIQDFAFVSKLLKYQVWIYVRLNTKVAPQYEEIVRSTGGDVVYYFALKGYVDPIDKAAFLSLVIAYGIMLIIFLLEIGIRIFAFRFSIPLPKGRSSVAIPEHKKSRKARKSVDDYEQFKRDALDNARKTLDDE